MIVAWACEYEVTDVFSHAHAGALWAVQCVVFPYSVKVLVDRGMAGVSSDLFVLCCPVEFGV